MTRTAVRISVATMLAIAFAFLMVSVVHAKQKVDVCHRTASDTNPYVLISVPADEANGHITGDGKNHKKPRLWKSDGIFRGVAHLAGDKKWDFYADEFGCEDITSESTPTPTPSPSPSSSIDIPATASPTPLPSEKPSITEDNPEWDCHTMGNRICGTPDTAMEDENPLFFILGLLFLVGAGGYLVMRAAEALDRR